MGKVTIAEDDVFELLHALTDSLWIKKEGLAEAELPSLCRKITAAANVEMEFEGRYHWIEFARSKQNSERPVAARYYGVITDGSPRSEDSFADEPTLQNSSKPFRKDSCP